MTSFFGDDLDFCVEFWGIFYGSCFAVLFLLHTLIVFPEVEILS